ncbi:MAG: hypothetical protein WA979_09320 [Pacificimonas sp.]
MVELKFILFVLLYGADAPSPDWTTHAYMTLEACHAGAEDVKARILANASAYDRAEHICLTRDRMKTPEDLGIMLTYGE